MFSEVKSIDSLWDSLLLPSEWIFQIWNTGGLQVGWTQPASLINSVDATLQGGLGVGDSPSPPPTSCLGKTAGRGE